MPLLLFLWSSVAVLLFSTEISANENRNLSETRATVKQQAVWPFVVAIVRSEQSVVLDELKCYGALIHKRYVVIPGICLSSSDTDGKVDAIVGFTKFGSDQGTQRIKEKKRYFFSEGADSDDNAQVNNIVLIELTKDADASPIILELDQETNTGTAAFSRVSSLDIGQIPPVIKFRTTEFTTVRDEDCSSGYFNPSTYVCAKPTNDEDSSASCLFDRGSPLIVDNNGLRKLIGIYTGTTCAINTAYYRLSDFKDKIEAIIGGENVNNDQALELEYLSEGQTTQELKISNNVNLSFSITSVTTPSDITLLENNCEDKTLSPGSSCDLRVKINVVGGDQTKTIDIQTDAVALPSFIVTTRYEGLIEGSNSLVNMVELRGREDSRVPVKVYVNQNPWQTDGTDVFPAAIEQGQKSVIMFTDLNERRFQFEIKAQSNSQQTLVRLLKNQTLVGEVKDTGGTYQAKNFPDSTVFVFEYVPSSSDNDEVKVQKISAGTISLIPFALLLLFAGSKRRSNVS